MLDAREAAHELARGAELLRSLLVDVDQATAATRPAPGRWSLLDVACHLLDEEREDFRVRLEHTLAGSCDWPAIDPQGWVQSRRYAERALADVLDELLAERRRSIAWLAALDAPDWDAAVQHPKLGRHTAGGFLAAWLDHDLLHARQLLGLHHLLRGRRTAPHAPDYAGGRWDPAT